MRIISLAFAWCPGATRMAAQDRLGGYYMTAREQWKWYRTMGAGIV